MQRIIRGIPMKRFAQYVLVTVMVVLMFAVVEPYLYPRKSWTVEGCTVNRDAEMPNGMNVRLFLRGPTVIEAEEETGLTKCIIPMGTVVTERRDGFVCIASSRVLDLSGHNCFRIVAEKKR
jgi:hypothetical protein